MVDLKISLPDNFYEEEERFGYIVTKQRKEVWAVELDLLAEFIRVCDKYRIVWFLDSGSCLGAVRHKGFIPWDDDIDISMSRSEYEKLCLVASKEFNHPYFFQTYESEPGYHRLHAQLRNSLTTGILKSEWPRYRFNQGIFIDIFPFDNVPDRNADRVKYGTSLIRRYRIFSFYLRYSRYYHPCVGYPFITRLKFSVLHLIVTLFFDRSDRLQKMLYRINDHITKYDGIDTECIANLSLPFSTFTHHYYLPKEWYSKCEMMPFEIFVVPVPVGYREYLSLIYGNWQTPVKSMSTHGSVYLDACKSYNVYLNLDDENALV